MKQIKVLLAEDHILVREGIRDRIQQETDMVVVGEASDGERAIELAEALHPDIVLMDVAMPIVNGIEATRRIKISCPRTNVLALTAYDNDEFIFAILQANASGYLLKNVRGDELVDSIRAVQQGELVIHPAVAKKLFKRFTSEKTAAPEPDDRRPLTRRELEIAQLGAQGLANKEIAYKLALSDRTIQSHWRNIFAKLHVGSRMEAVLLCLRNEWIRIDETDADQ